MPAKPYPKVPHLHIFWTPPGMGTPPPPWAACANAWPLSVKTFFPNIQSQPLLTQLDAIASRPIAGYLGAETNPPLTPPSCQVAVESDEVSCQPPPDWAAPAPSAAPHQTCSPDPSPAPLPFSGHAPAPQCPSWSEILQHCPGRKEISLKRRIGIDFFDFFCWFGEFCVFFKLWLWISNSSDKIFLIKTAWLSKLED